MWRAVCQGILFRSKTDQQMSVLLLLLATQTKARVKSIQTWSDCADAEKSASVGFYARVSIIQRVCFGRVSPRHIRHAKGIVICHINDTSNQEKSQYRHVEALLLPTASEISR